MEHILNGGASAVRHAPSTTCLGCYEETTTGPRTLAGAAFFNYTAVTPEMCGAPSSVYVYYGIVCGGECQFPHILFYLSWLTEANRLLWQHHRPSSKWSYHRPQPCRLLDALSRKRCGGENRMNMYKNLKQEVELIPKKTRRVEACVDCYKCLIILQRRGKEGIGQGHTKLRRVWCRA